MRNSARSVGWIAALAVLGLTVSARAAEVEVAGKPLEIDVTNTSIGNYHFNNKNDIPRTVQTKLDDDYAEWLNRFNLQLSYWRFTLGVRIDGYVAERPTDKRIATLVSEDVKPSDGKGTVGLTQQYIEDLNTRFLPTVYPTKLYLTYTQPSVEVTLGDFYVQLGRGLVFSVRKIDELSIDTTVRGAKAAFDKSFGGFHLGVLGFAGEMNPLRIDETSGRRLNSFGGDPLFFGFPKGNEFQYQDFSSTGNSITIDQAAQPNYLEDRAFGGKLEAGTKLFNVAANAAVVERRSFNAAYNDCLKQYPNSTDSKVAGTTIFQGLCQVNSPELPVTGDPSRDHNQIQNFSGSLNVPSILDHGDLYVEIAGQKLAEPRTTPDNSTGGFAAYVAGSLRAGPVSLSLEGKHYRSFYPIPANIDTLTQGSSAPEFNNIFYSSPPTAQSIYIEPVSAAAPNLCVTGGRALLTYRFNPRMSVFAWLGRFADWSELDPTYAEEHNCATHRQGGGTTTAASSSLETDTWDYAAGIEMFLENGKSKVNIYTGALDISAQSRLTINDGYTFYREGYVRYDLVKHIAGPFAIQAQGWHRRRYEPTTEVSSWWEGENYTALQWSPHFSAVFGFEYEIKDGCQTGQPVFQDGVPVTGKLTKLLNTCTFYNGGAQWRSNGSGGAAGKIFDTVNLFVGDRRGALRCVSGVCRVFPPFSGAKIELVSRF